MAFFRRHDNLEIWIDTYQKKTVQDKIVLQTEMPEKTHLQNRATLGQRNEVKIRGDSPGMNAQFSGYSSLLSALPEGHSTGY